MAGLRLPVASGDHGQRPADDETAVYLAPAAPGRMDATPLSGAVTEMVLKMCYRRADFLSAYNCPQVDGASNAVDLLLHY
jgi:hypothetical protein